MVHCLFVFGKFCVLGGDTIGVQHLRGRAAALPGAAAREWRQRRSEIETRTVTGARLSEYRDHDKVSIVPGPLAGPRPSLRLSLSQWWQLEDSGR
jgi:hypothetical protein